MRMYKMLDIGLETRNNAIVFLFKIHGNDDVNKTLLLLSLYYTITLDFWHKQKIGLHEYLLHDW